jgi:hypothetical protein
MKKCRIKKTCQGCGELFEVIPSIAHLRKNCSRECKGKSLVPSLPDITDRQMEIIVGSLLGDAHLDRPKKETHNSRFQKGQKVAMQEYQQNLYDELQPYSNSLKIYEKNRNLKEKIYIEQTILYHTCCHPIFSKLRTDWYTEERKILPISLQITPLTLAYWFCDDGYIGKNNNNAFICTHNFSKNEVERLTDLMKKNLKLEARAVKSKIAKNKTIQYMIYIGSKEYDYFLDIIRPHIPWACLQYKMLKFEKKFKHKKKLHSDLNQSVGQI